MVEQMEFPFQKTEHSGDEWVDGCTPVKVANAAELYTKNGRVQSLLCTRLSRSIKVEQQLP